AVGRTPRPALAEMACDVRGAHPPVAVPLRVAAAQPQAVRHPFAEEPVVAGRIRIAQGIRTDPQITPVQILGNSPGDLQVEGGDLLLDGRIVAVQIRVLCYAGGRCSGHALMVRRPRAWRDVLGVDSFVSRPVDT